MVFCYFLTGANQQFGEPGVWAGHAEERRSLQCGRWGGGGLLPQPESRQDVTGQAGAAETRHCGGVPGSPAHPHAQGCSCVLRGGGGAGTPPLDCPVCCALLHPPASLLMIFCCCCFFLFHIKQESLSTPPKPPLLIAVCLNPPTRV